MSLRSVDNLLFERGIDICHETVAPVVDQVRSHVCRRHTPSAGEQDAGLPSRRWHLDEMDVKRDGEMVYRWRAVDHEGEVLESYVTKTRDRAAALTFMKKALKRHGLPEAITTDGLHSYRGAMKDLRNAEKQEIACWANGR